jgi:hypothetical protein
MIFSTKLFQNHFPHPDNLSKNKDLLAITAGAVTKKAGDGDRTHILGLEGRCSAIELRPQYD